MGSPPQGSGNTDNEALREIRDILEESKKQTQIMIKHGWVMVILTILIFLIAILTLIMVFRA